MRGTRSTFSIPFAGELTAVLIPTARPITAGDFLIFLFASCPRNLGPPSIQARLFLLNRLL